MTENEIAREVVDSAYRIHSKLGPGLLESVYETLLVYELDKRNLRGVRLGLLINFHAPLIKNGISRVVKRTRRILAP